MSECKHECLILKRICIFFLGIVIGLAVGYKYGLVEAEQHHHDKFIKKAEKPMLLERRERQKMQRDRREKMRERKGKVSE